MVAVHLFDVSFWLLKVPSFKWFLWKSTPKIPYLKACVIILRDWSSFQKRILNLPGCLRGWKFDRICILCYPFSFWHRPFCPSPFKNASKLAPVTLSIVSTLGDLKPHPLSPYFLGSHLNIPFFAWNIWKKLMGCLSYFWDQQALTTSG